MTELKQQDLFQEWDEETEKREWNPLDQIMAIARLEEANEGPQTDFDPKEIEEVTGLTEQNLKAFDLCVKEAGLKQEEMDIWGVHNWHSNLLAVLSVGVGKLMSRDQLFAVVRKRLPNYAQTKDCVTLINNFYDKYDSEREYMSANLRGINAMAQTPAEATSEDDRELDKLAEGWNPPQLPNRLPRLIQLLVKPFPKQYHPMLTIAACVVLGSIASHYRSIYLDGRTIAANLYAAIIAGSGMGKSWVTELFEIMCKNTLRDWDKKEWAKERENKEERDKKANVKDRPPKYHPRFRIMETMSKTSFLEVQTNLGDNGMMLCNYTESDELVNATRLQFSNISVLLRKAWDLSIHQQYYMSDASCNTQCRLCAAILLTGTSRSVLGRLFSDTENGMMQRFIPMIMPRLKRTFRPPTLSPLSKDEEAERDALLMNLWQKDLALEDGTQMLEMPKTHKAVQAWYDGIEERYNDGELSEAEANLSHRVGQFMQRAAIPFVALYGEEQKEVLDLIRWLGNFAYYNICHLFEARVNKDMKESDEMLLQHIDGRVKALPLLDNLPETFTVKQFKEERVRKGQSENVRTLLSRYSKSGRIQRVDRGVYRKIK
ncbi:MAG: DUF3987 domain-containing protein [Bacteroidaceae bacterium]|nr:DUF3987 domain-containing protein [Bacteroidaceae bacterium]